MARFIFGRQSELMAQIFVPTVSCTNHLYTAIEGPVRIQYKCLVPIYVFLEMKLCSLLISKTELTCSFTQFLHSTCERFIFPGWVCIFCCSQICGPILEIYINHSQTHECGNWNWVRAIPKKGMHKWDFCCSVSGSGSSINGGWIYRAPQCLVGKQKPWRSAERCAGEAQMKI